ncbi:MAG: ABC transporter substrate-binding protein [Gemmatimonadota bacterium]
MIGRTVAAVVLSVATLACDRAAPNEKRVSLKIGVRPLLTVAPVYIAHAAGLYAEQGLDVELVSIEGVSSSVPLLIQGKIDVLPGPVSPSLFNAIHRGGRLRIVADKGQYFRDDCSQSVFVKSPAYAQRGGQPRRVGLMKETFNRMFIERALTTNGVNLDSVEAFYLPKAAEYDAIVSGRIDAANLGDVWLVRALAKGAVPWVRVNELMAGVQFSVFSYGPRLLDEEPDVGVRVALAHLKAMRLYNEGKTDRNLQIMARTLGASPDELRNVCWPRMREDGVIDTTSLVEFQKWALARGELDAVIPGSQFWDARFVEKANELLKREQ